MHAGVAVSLSPCGSKLDYVDLYKGLWYIFVFFNAEIPSCKSVLQFVYVTFTVAMSTK